MTSTAPKIYIGPSIYVGIDDTDMPDTPGTNKLALHLAHLLHDDYETRWIVRHQLLEDPRVPCTNRNGCVSLELAPRSTAHTAAALIPRLRDEILRWIPAGSDPGLCIVEQDVIERDPLRFIAWGRLAQAELVGQQTALRIAADTNVYLEPLAGSGDGVIGALAAVGLLATWNSGRVIHSHRVRPGALDLRGTFAAEEILEFGVDEILSLDDNAKIQTGAIDLGKRLRPNMRDRKMVLYVAPQEDGWLAQRIVS